MVKRNILQQIRWIKIFRESGRISVHKGTRLEIMKKKTTTLFCYGNQCPVSGTLPEVIVHEHKSLCRPWTRVRDLAYKEEAIWSRNTAVFSGLAHLERHHQCWKACFQGKRHHLKFYQDNTKPHTASIRTA